MRKLLSCYFQLLCKTICFCTMAFAGTQSISTNKSVLTFKKSGKEVKQVELSSMKANHLKINGKSLSFEDRQIYHGFRQYERMYRGYNFFSVLDAVYGRDWRKGKSITFTARDGYVQAVLISEMLKAAHGKTGLLALREIDEKTSQMKPLSTFERGTSIIDPGPITLLWTGFPIGTQVQHGDPLKWPYQLVEIDML